MKDEAQNIKEIKTENNMENILMKKLCRCRDGRNVSCNCWERARKGQRVHENN